MRIINKTFCQIDRDKTIGSKGDIPDELPNVESTVVILVKTKENSIELKISDK